MPAESKTSEEHKKSATLEGFKIAKTVAIVAIATVIATVVAVISTATVTVATTITAIIMDIAITVATNTTRVAPTAEVAPPPVSAQLSFTELRRL